METQSTFAARLKWWRERRGLSQLDLAHAADVSQRHVSFIEVGRTAPSREMVLKLAAALDLSLRQQNALLLAAGFAPVWRESALSAPELVAVNRALDFMLAQQEPYAAFVVDRRWNLLRANNGGQNLVAFLTDTQPQAPDPAQPINLADALLAPDALAPADRQLARGCAAFPARRARGCACRRHRGNRRAARAAARLCRCPAHLGYPRDRRDARARCCRSTSGKGTRS